MLVLGVAVYRRGEPIGDPGQRRGRGNRQAQPAVDVADQHGRVLQLRLIHVQIHPVDAFHFESDVLGKDIDHTARYCHHRLRSGSGGHKATNCQRAVIYPRRPPPPRGIPTRPEPPNNPKARRHVSSGWGEAPLDLV